MPLRIFSTAKLFLPTVKSILQVSMVFSINFMTSSGILYILRQSTIHLWGTTSYYYLYYFLRIFRTCFSRWSFTKVWIISSHFKFPILFSVFWPILSMLYLGGLGTFSDFQSFQPISQAFEDCYVWYLFKFCGKVQLFFSLFVFFNFHQSSAETTKSIIQ